MRKKRNLRIKRKESISLEAGPCHVYYLERLSRACVKLSVPEPSSGLSISDIVAKTTSLARNLCLKPKWTLKVWTRMSFMLQRGKRCGGRLCVPRAACTGPAHGLASPHDAPPPPQGFSQHGPSGQRMDGTGGRHTSPTAGMPSARHQAISSWGTAGADCVCAEGGGIPGHQEQPGPCPPAGPVNPLGTPRLNPAPVGPQGPEIGRVDCKRLHLSPNSRLIRQFKRS